ncbi:MAG TPA: hypothetical protein VKG24_26365 [Pseudolabrys sp.]|nr:hypothetical protein [Pseudolabrys sp.]
MTIEIKQDAGGRHWFVDVDGMGIGGFESKKEAERFVKSEFKSKDDVERFKKQCAEIKKIEWWDDEQDEQMRKILHRAHKAEAKKRGHRFKFYERSFGAAGSPTIFSDTDRGGFWTGVNPYTMEAHHLWYPCDKAEMDQWRDLINRKPPMN